MGISKSTRARSALLIFLSAVPFSALAQQPSPAAVDRAREYRIDAAEVMIGRINDIAARFDKICRIKQQSGCGALQSAQWSNIPTLSGQIREAARQDPATFMLVVEHEHAFEHKVMPILYELEHDRD